MTDPEAEQANFAASTDTEQVAFFARWDELYANEGIVRPTRANLPTIAMLQAKMDRAGPRAGLDVTLSIGGLVIATGAGILSLLIQV